MRAERVAGAAERRHRRHRGVGAEPLRREDREGGILAASGSTTPPRDGARARTPAGLLDAIRPRAGGQRGTPPATARRPGGAGRHGARSRGRAAPPRARDPDDARRSTRARKSSRGAPRGRAARGGRRTCARIATGTRPTAAGPSSSRPRRRGTSPPRRSSGRAARARGVRSGVMTGRGMDAGDSNGAASDLRGQAPGSLGLRPRDVRTPTDQSQSVSNTL